MIDYRLAWLELKQARSAIYVTWQVALCDLIRQVMFCSSAVGFL